MQSVVAKPVSNRTLWTARVIGGLAVLFLLFDATIHALVPPAVAQAFAPHARSLRSHHRGC